MTTTLGITFACTTDFTARFAVATSDEQILRDEVLHRLTCDSVLGDTDEARGFGLDVRQNLGARMSGDDPAALGPTLAAVLQRSPRIDAADVIVTSLPSTTGMLALQFAITVTAVTGVTFTFLFRLTGATFEQVGTT